jgi:AcrR family transcriptional regulator
VPRASDRRVNGPRRRNEMAIREKLSPGKGPPDLHLKSEGRALSEELGSERVLAIQRVRLINAMVDVCAERGAGSVSVAHVVERAGVSRRTFYELFGDREDCFLVAFEDALERASLYVLERYDADASWLERVRASLIGSLRFLDDERPMGRLLVVGSLGAGHRAIELRQRGIALIISLIDEGRRESKRGAELPPLTAEGIAGGVLSVLHSRLIDDRTETFVELAGPLMSMVVSPYLGPAAARRELSRPVPCVSGKVVVREPDPLRELGMRLTYRTVRVLMAVAATPGGSNRQVADHSDITDQGQISKLLARLHGLGLIENTGAGSVRGAPNSWVLTDRGWDVQGALARNAA